MTDDALPTYAELMADLAARGLDGRTIADRISAPIGVLHRLRSLDKAAPDNERYRRLLRLQRQVRAYGNAV